MVTVTTAAKERLKEDLQKQTTDPEVAIRVTRSPSEPNRLELVLDKEKEGDQVVETEEGTKILLIGPDLVSALEGFVVDYEETPEGASFSISKPAPGT
jgi:Fe-S cluster assembly iron-binding protein IscA